MGPVFVVWGPKATCGNTCPPTFRFSGQRARKQTVGLRPSLRHGNVPDLGNNALIAQRTKTRRKFLRRTPGIHRAASRRWKRSVISRKWRPDRESNSGARICSPLRNHSAIGPGARRCLVFGVGSTGACRFRRRKCDDRPFDQSLVGLTGAEAPSVPKSRPARSSLTILRPQPRHMFSFLPSTRCERRCERTWWPVAQRRSCRTCIIRLDSGHPPDA